MAKKKKSSVGLIFYLVACVLGIAAVCMMFLRAVAVPDVKTAFGTVETDAGFTGLEVIFGYEEEGVKGLAFSFMALLPYLLVVAGIVLTVVNLLKKKGGLLNYVSVGLFVVGGILMFLMPSFMAFADTVAGAVLEKVEYELAVGSILAGVLSILAGAVVLVKSLLKK